MLDLIKTLRYLYPSILINTGISKISQKLFAEVGCNDTMIALEEERNGILEQVIECLACVVEGFIVHAQDSTWITEDNLFDRIWFVIQQLPAQRKVSWCLD